MTRNEFIDQANHWGARKVPFLFIIDFELENLLAYRLDEINPAEILYTLHDFSNAPGKDDVKPGIPILQKYPLPFSEYMSKFEVVARHLNYGDSYLTNLTTKTPITLTHSLRDIFYSCSGNYKLLYRDQFLVFSPECFIKIKAGKIFSFPMKGTIDAALPGAREIMMSDAKELAEHVTIVDLIRNDLSQVATRVEVTRFRYLEEIKTNYKNLLQVSSEITGDLAPDYSSRLGEILLSLLPAGSVSGAPKPKTVEIIKEAEKEKRGYYTGVFGYFDGHSLDSAVMIRYIEKQQDKFFYRSGGGITTQSMAAREYQETVDKVYIPVK